MSLSVVKLKACSADLVCRSPIKPKSEVKDIDADKISNRLLTASYSVSEPLQPTTEFCPAILFWLPDETRLIQRAWGLRTLRKLSLHPTKCRDQLFLHYEEKLLELKTSVILGNFSCDLCSNLVATQDAWKIARSNIPCLTHSSQFFYCRNHRQR